MLEVRADDVVANPVEALRRHHAGIENLALGAALVGLNLLPIMVGPHEGELEARVVAGLEESDINGPVQERAVVVVVPVEDERIHAVVGGGGDFLLHDLRVRLVGVAPERHVRLMMAGEPRPGRLDQLPLRPIPALAFHVARVAGMVVAEVVTGHRDPRLRVSPRRGGRGRRCRRDRHGDIVQSRRGLRSLEREEDRGACRNILRDEFLLRADLEIARSKFRKVAVENRRVQEHVGVPRFGDVERERDVRRLVKNADVLAEEAEVGGIARRRCRAAFGMDGIRPARPQPTFGQPRIPRVLTLRQAAEVAEVAVDDAQRPRRVSREGRRIDQAEQADEYGAQFHGWLPL